MRAAHLLLLTSLLACGDKATDSGDPPAGDTGADQGDGAGGDDGGAGAGGGGEGGEGGEGGDGGDDGDDGGGDDGGPDPLLLVGAWIDDEGNEHVISETQWLVDFGAGEQYTYALTGWDNGAGWVVGENGAGNVGEAGFWSRFDFAIDGGGTAHVCQSTGTAADEQAALDATPADASGAPTSGCAYWGWLALTPR